MADVQRKLRRGKQEKPCEVGRVTPLPGLAGQVKEICLYPEREPLGILSRERTL